MPLKTKLMIKNIIFDMGRVLIDFDRDYFLDAFGVNDIEDRKILMKEVFFSVEWAMMDRGTLDEKQAYERVIKNIPERLHSKAYDCLFNWDKVVKPIKGMTDYVKELKERGYKIYLLSNASHRCLDEYFETFEVSKYFDGKVVSAFVNRVKPERDIFEHLLNKYNLKKEECVFIDDAIQNVDGAIFYGIKALVFYGDTNEFKEKLELILKEN